MNKLVQSLLLAASISALLLSPAMPASASAVAIFPFIATDYDDLCKMIWVPHRVILPHKIWSEFKCFSNPPPSGVAITNRFSAGADLAQGMIPKRPGLFR